MGAARGLIVLAGYLVRFPLGGYAWQAAHYLLGLRRLGYDIWFYEDTGYYAPAFNPVTRELGPAYAYGIEAAAGFLSRLGLEERWVFVDTEHGAEYGPGAAHVETLIREADLVINMGKLNRQSIEQRAGRPAVYIDLDPVYTQIKLVNGDGLLQAALDSHTHLFTFGENIGTPRSPVPIGDYTWHPTRQPVVIEQWAGAACPGPAYTTIGQWNSQGRDLTYHGQTLSWSKREQWLRCLDLPAQTAATFEVAMDVDRVPGDPELLAAHGWRVVDPFAISADPWRYRDYVRGSRAEFTAAKDMNIRLRSGWFSDRAACYLAAGRPVVEQDTGFGDVLPLGPGLHAFRTVADAADAVRLIEADYAMPARMPQRSRKNILPPRRSSAVCYDRSGYRRTRSPLAEAMRQSLTIIVTGYAATYPVGGATWDYLQYILGFKRLGHRVYYLEDTGRWMWDAPRETFSDDVSWNAAYLGKWLAAMDPELANHWALRGVRGQYYGMTRAQVARLCREADVFINYSGSCVLREEYMACLTKVYLDSDPLYNQAGLLEYVRGTADDNTRRAVDSMRQHDKFLSFGENIGRPHCSIPSVLFPWQPTRQPIVLGCWDRPRAPLRDVYTTVMSWQPDGGHITVDGAVYGGKHAEFGKFINLPRRTRQPLELAVGGGLPPVDLLRRHGWHVVDGYAVSSDPWTYRDYVCSSKGEFSVAKQAYVATRSGWFSCRSACYLAAGKPVVVQDTGFAEHIPTGEGLLAFSTEDEALEAIERINRDYERHAAAAACLARGYFDSRRVLQEFLETVLA